MTAPVLDFLTTIVNVQFGGPWLCFSCLASSDFGTGVTLNFPQAEGGTPGIVALQGGFSPPGFGPATWSLLWPKLAPQPPITAKQLATRSKSGAGVGYRGFGTGATQFGVTETFLFLQCGSGLLLPSGKSFMMNIVAVSAPNAGLVVAGGFISPKGALNAGPFPPVFLGPNNPLLTVLALPTDGDPIPIVVDPKALTITGAI